MAAGACARAAPELIGCGARASGSRKCGWMTALRRGGGEVRAPQRRPSVPLAEPGLFQIRRGEVPVDKVIEEDLDVLRTRVAVVDIVRVFPDVAGYQRGFAMDDRVVGVMGGLDCN